MLTILLIAILVAVLIYLVCRIDPIFRRSKDGYILAFDDKVYYLTPNGPTARHVERGTLFDKQFFVTHWFTEEKICVNRCYAVEANAMKAWTTQRYAKIDVVA